MSTKRSVFHVVPKGHEWVVRREGGTVPDVRKGSRVDAVAAGRSLARNAGQAELRVHRRDGSIQEARTYGVDPLKATTGRRSDRTASIATSKTIHIFRSQDGWIVAQDGSPSQSVFDRKEDAVKAGRILVESGSSGQVVIHSETGQIHRAVTHQKARPVKNPVGKGKLGMAEIDSAISGVVLARLDPFPRRDK